MGRQLFQVLHLVGSRGILGACLQALGFDALSRVQGRSYADLNSMIHLILKPTRWLKSARPPAFVDVKNF